MRRPRLTARRIMALVVVLAVGLAPVVPAAQVASDQGYHQHGSIVLADPSNNPGGIHGLDGFPLMQRSSSVSTPFWARCRRRLGGRSWGAPSACRPREGHFADACASADPEMVDGDQLVPTPEMRAAFDRISRSLNSRPDAPGSVRPATRRLEGTP